MSRGGQPTHGHCRGGRASPEYRVWCQLIRRCTKPKHPKYPSYGGRGITVCDQWRNSFAAFIADMGIRPSAKHSLERRDNDGPYSKANCIWAPRAVQDRNKRTNRHVTIAGQRLCLVDAAKLAGLSLGTFRMRLEHGWTPERAFSTPAQRYRRSATSASSRSASA